VKPAQGQIMFLGERIDGLSSHEIVKRGIAHCPERQKLFPEMTVMENIELGAYLRKDHDQISRDLDRVFSLFPILEERKSEDARTLSGGEQQMLAMGRAIMSIMSNPTLLLLDEPSLGLAPLVLFETIQPDEFLRPYLDEYAWLCKFYMLYRKKFYPKEHFELDEADGAKTRELIREHVDVEELKREFTIFQLLIAAILLKRY
jgi:hypothetical protein